MVDGPPPPDPMRADLGFVGTVSMCPVTIGGYDVPDVEAREIEHGTKLNIFVDGRFGITVPIECGQSVVWLLANAMAHAAGYSCHGANSVWRPNPYKVGVVKIGSDDGE